MCRLPTRAMVFVEPEFYAAAMTVLNGSTLRPFHVVATDTYVEFCEEALAVMNRERSRGRDRPGPIRIKTVQLVARISATEVVDQRGPAIDVRRVHRREVPASTTEAHGGRNPRR